jgi:hypothetical protein
MSFPIGDKLELLTDESGIDRTIRWVHYMEEPGYHRFLRGGELVVTTSMLIKSTDAMLDFIYSLERKGCAGLVLNPNKPLKELGYVGPAIEAANKLHFNLFWMPWEIAIVDLFQIICKEIVRCEMSKNSLENLMNYLLDSEAPLDDKYVDALEALGYVEGKPYVSVVMKIVPRSPTAYVEQYRIQSIIIAVYEKAREANHNFILHVTRGNKIIFMLAALNGKTNVISRLMADVAAKNKNPAFEILSGVGPAWIDLKKFKESVQIADRLTEKRGNKGVVNFSELDLERLLYKKSVDMNEITEIVDSIFGELEHADDKKAGDLKHILKVYVKNMCNLTDAAKELFMHVNTLRYKIQKIEEYCGCSIKNPDVYFRFYLGSKLEEVLASKNADETQRAKRRAE